MLKLMAKIAFCTLVYVIIVREGYQELKDKTWICWNEWLCWHQFLPTLKNDAAIWWQSFPGAFFETPIDIDVKYEMSSYLPLWHIFSTTSLHYLKAVNTFAPNCTLPWSHFLNSTYLEIFPLISFIFQNFFT